MWCMSSYTFKISDRILLFLNSKSNSTSLLSFAKHIKVITFLASTAANGTLLLPLTALQLYGSVAHVLPIHFSHRTDEVVLPCDTHEPKAFRFQSNLIPDNPSLDKCRILFECICEHIVIHLVTKVSAEYAVVVLWPLLQGRVLPYLPSCLPQNFLFSLVVIQSCLRV